MATDTTFDRLTRTLSSSERSALLKRVKEFGVLSESETEGEEEGERLPESELDLMRLGLIARIMIFLVSLFTGRPRGDVLHDMVLRRLGEEILHVAPGILDPRRSIFLERAREELNVVSSGASVFREPLRRALGEEQDEFLAFLTGHLLPHVQEKLSAVTDLVARSQDLEAVEIGEARRRVHEDLDQAVASIPEDERRAVYADVQAIHRLRAFASLPFAEMLEGFAGGEVEGECPFVRIRKHLPLLDAQLGALRHPPSGAALEGLFMFSHRDEIGTEGFSLEGQLTEDLGKASAALLAMRAFEKRVPLTKIVRFVTANLEYQPRATGGGEDWFILFKRYWTGRVDASLRAFAREKERKQLVAEVETYLELHRLPRPGMEGLSGVALEVVQENELALSLVLGFSEEVFFKLARFFSMLLERGRFVKEDNKRELGQVYTSLNELDARTDALMSSLRGAADLQQSPEEGDARRALEQRATKMVENFLDECAASIKLLTNILEGILRGSTGGRYDTVTNLDGVGDWQGKMMSEILEEGYDRIVEGLSLLGRVRTL